MISAAIDEGARDCVSRRGNVRLRTALEVTRERWLRAATLRDALVDARCAGRRSRVRVLRRRRTETPQVYLMIYNLLYNRFWLVARLRAPRRRAPE